MITCFRLFVVVVPYVPLKGKTGPGKPFLHSLHKFRYRENSKCKCLEAGKSLTCGLGGMSSRPHDQRCGKPADVTQATVRTLVLILSKVRNHGR